MTDLQQTEQVFKNIEGALAAVGSSLKDVIRSRVFIPYLEHKHPILDVIAKRYRGILPVSTIVSGPLGNPDFKIEIEVQWKSRAFTLISLMWP
ncbi:Rid family hydrolase [Mesorhizobium sp.]|uniref:Rid family hydrolase n=1 Tax=Mesorhizobium sp. TaxID=1871066 RepID=UPI00257EE388|nr:Rid family hydrolase [Mesorhizobium sp.]